MHIPQRGDRKANDYVRLTCVGKPALADPTDIRRCRDPIVDTAWHLSECRLCRRHQCVGVDVANDTDDGIAAGVLLPPPIDELSACKSPDVGAASSDGTARRVLAVAGLVEQLESRRH